MHVHGNVVIYLVLLVVSRENEAFADEVMVGDTCAGESVEANTEGVSKLMTQMMVSRTNLGKEDEESSENNMAENTEDQMTQKVPPPATRISKARSINRDMNHDINVHWGCLEETYRLDSTTIPENPKMIDGKTVENAAKTFNGQHSGLGS